MEHRYTQAQADAVKSLLDKGRAEHLSAGTGVYVSSSHPGSVFVRCTHIEIANDGGGGYKSEWSIVDQDGNVLRDAYRNLEFNEWYDRHVFFENLIEISAPE